MKQKHYAKNKREETNNFLSSIENVIRLLCVYQPNNFEKNGRLSVFLVKSNGWFCSITLNLDVYAKKDVFGKTEGKNTQNCNSL